MRCIDVKQFKENVKPDAESATFTDSSGIESTVSFGYQKTGYGLKRFFLCPCCAKRVQKLYQVDYSYKCRDCAGINPYRGITNMTKGGADEIAYRMIRYAEKMTYSLIFLLIICSMCMTKELKSSHSGNVWRFCKGWKI